ncbi:MAG: ferrous iron transport protein B [Betaproteobacteria bacterium RBG_16_64_18]|nr:MAG: ferrous iron transport protein B [Betaproteobacteria bacterium RBG_16_64_18]
MKRIALIGMPNTGKSTLFNRLTGAHAKVGNWPGITVELLAAKILIGGDMVQVVDLPGIYDLRAHSSDEAVVTAFLAQDAADLAIVVLNASQIERQITLLGQLARPGLRVILVLNMADEAATLGITIDRERLSSDLGVPVCLISAKYGQGVEQLHALITAALRGEKDSAPVLASGERLTEELLDAAIRRSVMVPAHASHALTEKIDRVLLHPWLGLPIFFVLMFLLFQAVFFVGKPIQDAMAWALGALRTAVLDAAFAGLPAAASGLLLDGIYNGLGTVASFVPLIILFFLCMAIVEDTGYLSRAAFLMDALMSKFGLDGRSFVMILMGFGCNVPALMGTRVMRSRGLRLLTMLVIPLSLCSARLQVFLFFIAALFPTSIGPVVLFSLYLFSIAGAMLTSQIFKPRFVNNDPFVLEIPPYRFPTLRQMVLRGWQEVSHFLRRATRFIVAGVVLVWLLTNFPAGTVQGSADTWAGQIGNVLNPVLSPLGIDPKLTIALIFGFVAKEVVIGALAVIYAQEGSALMTTIAGQINWVQAYSFMLFTLIYTPCLSTIATIRAEARSTAFTALAVAWPLALAWVASFVFYQTARLILA